MTAILHGREQCAQGIPVILVQQLHHMPGPETWKALVSNPALPRVPVCMVHDEACE